jgi:hypothetical protein
MKLLVNALTKFTCGLLMVGLLIFLPAGTLCYPYGWLLMCLLFIPMLIAGFVMLFKAPDLLVKRLDAKEKQSTQKGVLALSGLMFIGGFVVAGLDFRFGWSAMPLPVTVAASVLFLFAYALYAEVLRCPGLVEDVQQTYRVMICGPTTITAFLNTLRMGFRTIALDKRAAEVWKVLGAAKAQYDTFETVLKKVRRKLEEAGNTLDEADRRNRVIKSKLKGVEALESSEAERLLAFDGTTDDTAEEDV